MVTTTSRRGSIAWGAPLAIVLAVAALGACSGGAGAPSSGPRPIPAPTSSPKPTRPRITTPTGGPVVQQLNAPISFACLAQDPAQAQVTLGWIVPSADHVTVTLDGQALPRGIRAALPYDVPAGPAAGPGATVVFACDSAPHTITLGWRFGRSPTTTRSLSVTRVATP